MIGLLTVVGVTTILIVIAAFGFGLSDRYSRGILHGLGELLQFVFASGWFFGALFIMDVWIKVFPSHGFWTGIGLLVLELAILIVGIVIGTMPFALTEKTNHQPV